MAPADLPGSRSPYKEPGQIGVELGAHPFETGAAQSYVPLGEAVIDRRTGQVTVDGAPIGDNQGRCADQEPQPVKKTRPQGSPAPLRDQIPRSRDRQP